MMTFEAFKATRRKVECLAEVFPENEVAGPGYVWNLEGWKLLAAEAGDLVRWYTDEGIVEDTIEEMEKLLYLEYR